MNIATIGEHLREALAAPDTVFGGLDDEAIVVRTRTGSPMLVADELSFENGAPGVVALASSMGWDDLLPVYSDYLLTRLSMLSSHVQADRAGNVQGLLLAAPHLEPVDGRWRRVRQKLESTIGRKLDSHIDLIERNTADRNGALSYGFYDCLRGAGRDLQILRAFASTELTSERLQRAADAFDGWLNHPSGLPSPTQGAPFFDMDFPAETHWNLGTAHGATGVAHVLLSLSEELRSRNLDDGRQRESVARFVGLMSSLTAESAPPMYAFSSANEVQYSEVQTRPSWCYGAPGYQLLRIASSMLDHDDEAMAAARDRLVRAVEDRESEFEDLSLCHGYAGVLASITIVAALLPDDKTRNTISRLTDLVASHFSSAARYGFVYHPQGLDAPADIPGILNGAAGVLYALQLASHPLGALEARSMIMLQSPWLSA